MEKVTKKQYDVLECILVCPEKQYIIDFAALVAATCRGGSLTVLYGILGALTIVGGIALLATPVSDFVTLGYCIVILFFINCSSYFGTVPY